jgi:hypothetical protein
MNEPGTPHIAVALVHHPVYDRHQDVVTTSVTSVDIHDIARTARTYGCEPYYMVTPIVAQQAMMRRVTEHWVDGEGTKADHPRVEAMSRIQVIGSLAAAVADLQTRHGVAPRVVVTGAGFQDGITTFRDMRQELERGDHPSWLIVFGTGWGLTKELVAGADRRLEPILGLQGFNHLSVRAAVAIVLDRLLGARVY